MPLVGRKQELLGLESFVRDSPERLSLVIGRGGIGKTRLLRTIADAAERDHGYVVRFLGGSGEVRPEHSELLPDGPRLLIVVDDAHDRADLAEILASIARNRPHAKLLLALRPYGINPLAQDLRRVGKHFSEIPKWELEDLKVSEAETLAESILHPSVSHVVAERLARVSAGCPLVAVVGAGLINRGQLDPQRLGGDASIRTEILRAFRDALVADPATGNAELRREVLDGVAILQPFREGDPAFRAALEQLTGVPFDRVVAHLKALEDAGVLLRRGQSLRIVPDLLGDVVLAEACFDDRSGISTGYIDRVIRVGEGEPLQHVFINASRLDWQIRIELRHESSLVDSLWTAIENEFRTAGVRGRREIVQLLRRVAFYQPDRTLALVRWALDHPTDKVEPLDHALAQLYPPPKYEKVLHELPGVLRHIAYNLDFLPDAADLLWRLAQTDLRPTNQYHPIRVLSDLASYEKGKPLAYNEVIVDAAERWLADEHVGSHPHSPFDVLRPLLATEGVDVSFKNHTVSLAPFAIVHSAVSGLRDRVLTLAFREARSPDVRRAVRAVKVIEEALRYPSGRGAEACERDAWTPGFVEAIKRLGDLAGDLSLE